MRIIDAHAHIFPDGIADKATAATESYFPTPKPPHHHGRADELAEAMKAAGIDYALVFSAATAAHQVESIHRFVYEAARKHPQFLPCGTLHVGFENYREELRWLRDHGIHGAKLHPEFQHFALDDPRLFPMYEEMERNDMFLVAHMGDPRTDYSGPRHMIPIVETFPRLRCIACHFGNWGDWRLEAVEPLLKYDNVYTDISSTFSYVTGDHGPLYEILRAYDPTHIFFGTDYPIFCPKEEVAQALSLDIGQELLEDILFHNFARFYHYREL